MSFSFANFFHIFTRDLVHSTWFSLGFLLVLPPLTTKDLICRERNQIITLHQTVGMGSIQI